MKIIDDKNYINEIIETSLKNINQLIDVNTVIGKPISGLNGQSIIPFSKVTVGVLVGGGEYGKLNILSKGNLPLTAGNGAIISMKPCGFLVSENENEKYRIVSVSETAYEKIIEKAGDVMEKIKNETTIQ